MHIGQYLRTSLLSAILLPASGRPGFANESRPVALSHDVVLGGTTLPAGRYVARWHAHSPRATVEFVRDNKVVLSTEARFEDRGKKYPSTTVVYDTAPNGIRTLLEIRLGGSSKVLMFSQ